MRHFCRGRVCNQMLRLCSNSYIKAVISPHHSSSTGGTTLQRIDIYDIKEPAGPTENVAQLAQMGFNVHTELIQANLGKEKKKNIFLLRIFVSYFKYRTLRNPALESGPAARSPHQVQDLSHVLLSVESQNCLLVLY